MCCKISIIVPVYKVESYINKCIESILSQTFTDFELILVDDGTPDRCSAICDEYAKRDQRVKVIHKDNGGLSSARNAGLDIAKGEYIGFVDSDDYISEDMFEILYNLSKEYDADVVECGFSKIYGEFVEEILHKEHILMGDNMFALELLLKYWFHSITCNKIYKAYLFSQIRFPFGKIHEDEFIMHKIFYSLKRYVYIGKSKYFYVQREKSIMAEPYSLKRMNRLEAYENRFYFLKDNIKDESLMRLAECKYFNDILSNYHSLSINKKLDLNKAYRKNLKNRIVKNYSGFNENDYLTKYKLLINISKLNQTLFDMLYMCIFMRPEWYFKAKYKSIIFIHAQLRKLSYIGRLKAFIISWLSILVRGR